MNDDGVLAMAQARLDARREKYGITKPTLVPLHQEGDDDHCGHSEEQHVGLSEIDPPDPSDPYQTHVPDGKYTVSYRKHEKGPVYGRCVYFVHFAIVEPEEHRGKALLRFINEPPQWKGKRRGSRTRSLPRSSSLWDDFLAITGRRPSNRVFALSELYRGALLRALVVEVTRGSNEGGRVELPKAARYSKIQRFLGQAAGPHSSFRGAPQF